MRGARQVEPPSPGDSGPPAGVLGTAGARRAEACPVLDGASRRGRKAASACAGGAIIDVSRAVGVLLFTLGVGFLAANLRILGQFVRYRRLRASALVTWPGRKPPFYGWLLALGVVAGILVFVKLVVQQQPPQRAFGEGMMLIYYAYAVPLRLRIGRGLYAGGIWSDGGFVPYAKIGGLSWREGGAITLVIIYRLRSLARRLTVPRAHYGEVRRVLRDKIAAHDIHFTGRSLDLGTDERDLV